MSCLNVWIDQKLVGEWQLSPQRVQSFRYDSSWRNSAQVCPLSLSLPVTSENDARGPAVESYFANLLPGRADKRRQLQVLFGADSEHPFALLAAIGRDCSGAAQILPPNVDPAPLLRSEGRDIASDEVGEMLQKISDAGMGVLFNNEPVCASLAGAQEKSTLHLEEIHWRVPTGITSATHILKPTIGFLPNGIDLSKSVENEHLCMRLTAALGIPAANTSMKTFGLTRTLIVERFDRRWTKDKRLLRLPQEDLCQALGIPPARKYQSEGGPGIRDVLAFLKASDDPQADRRMFMKAQIVFWLLGATDGHAKNFSIFLYPGGGFRLTPLYDVMSLQPVYAANQIKRNRMKLAMSVGEQRHYVLDTIQPRHFVQSAQSAAMPVSEVEVLFGEIANAGPLVLEELRSSDELPSQIRRSIREGFEARLKLLESHGT